jgi:hypothetical protein
MHFCSAFGCNNVQTGNLHRLRQITAYADDILLMARTEQTLIGTFLKLKGEAKGYGLVVNEGKTEISACLNMMFLFSCLP